MGFLGFLVFFYRNKIAFTRRDIITILVLSNFSRKKGDFDFYVNIGKYWSYEKKYCYRFQKVRFGRNFIFYIKMFIFVGVINPFKNELTCLALTHREIMTILVKSLNHFLKKWILFALLKKFC